MGKQIVMNATGDTRYEFNPADAVAVAKASTRFKELTGAGYTAAVRRGAGASSSFATSIPLPTRPCSFRDCAAGRLTFEGELVCCRRQDLQRCYFSAS